MKIEYPSDLIEFILAGILIEASILLIIPDLKIEGNLFWSLVLISGAYLCGLGFNSIATLYFSKFIAQKIQKRKLLKNKPYIDLAQTDIEKIFGIRISDNIGDLRKINSLMHNFVVRKSEHYKANHNYQMRLYRMSRTAFMIVVYWIFFMIIGGFNLIPNTVISSLLETHCIVFWFLIIILIFFAISLHLAAMHRISYISGESFSHFISLLKMNDYCDNDKKE